MSCEHKRNTNLPHTVQGKQSHTQLGRHTSRKSLGQPYDPAFQRWQCMETRWGNISSNRVSKASGRLQLRGGARQAHPSCSTAEQQYTHHSQKSRGRACLWLSRSDQPCCRCFESPWRWSTRRQWWVRHPSSAYLSRKRIRSHEDWEEGAEVGAAAEVVALSIARQLEWLVQMSCGVEAMATRQWCSWQ